MEFHRRSLTLSSSALIIIMTKIRKSHTSFEMRPRASRLLMAAALSVFPASPAPAQTAPTTANEPMTFTVHSGQPIRDVLDSLQKRFLSPITFEEVPYESSTDLSAHGTVITGSGPKSFFGTPVVDFNIAFSQFATTPYLAAQELVASYESRRLPGYYKVIQSNRRVDVVPDQVLGKNGTKRNVVPIMSRLVSFPPETRSTEDVLQLIFDQIFKETGSKVILIEPAFPPSVTFRFGADRQSGADIVSAIGTLLHTPLSFRCTYSPTDRVYYFIVQAVVPAA
jgi:hypothetical protein